MTAGVEPDARWRVWEEPAALLPASYQHDGDERLFSALVEAAQARRDVTQG